MDRKSILVIVACIGLMVVWTTVLVPKYFTQPLPPGATNQVNVAEASPATGPSDSIRSVATNVPAGEPIVSTPSAAVAEEPEQLLEEVYDQVRYVFTSHGGGIRQVDLLNYPEKPTAGTKDHGNNGVASLNKGARLPVLDLVGNALSGFNYSLARTPDGIQAEAVLGNGLTVVKEYQFLSNYVFTAR
ncbi:MAG: hypothetical protein MUC91_00255, partial [Verrucomicrobia bacterium]|nr:hypothetical protein [Verrucomicrobiota bacterium]